MSKNSASYSVSNQIDATNLLRKGAVGDGKNYFTSEQNDRFEKNVFAKLKGSGLEFDYEL